VLGLLARGYSNKQIAQRLFVTPKTVSSHVEHVYLKPTSRAAPPRPISRCGHGLVGSFEAAT
jgi:FixJ family two-component response regulator